MTSISTVRASATQTGPAYQAMLVELLGAGVMTVVIGWAADKLGLDILPWVLGGFAAPAILLALGLRETAPRLVARAAPQ